MPASQKVKPRTKAKLACRIAAYVNEHFDGNLSQAATALGCNYSRLREQALGLSVKPNLDVLTALAKDSRLSIEVWLGEDA